jgi:uncharacterized protein
MSFAVADSLLPFYRDESTAKLPECVMLLSLRLQKFTQNRLQNPSETRNFVVLVCQSGGMTLDLIQIRVLGALIEKEIATPETYPLSLNSLILACNQRSSRDPVLELTEEEVRQALHTLEDMGLTAPVRDSRVAKYEHRIRTVLNLRRDETAVLCLLFLRGPQTPGEIRSRADRLYSFSDLEAVQSTLERLASRPESEAAGPLTVMLPRQPGARESRYAHLLGGPVDTAMRAVSAAPVVSGRGGDSVTIRLGELEIEVAGLKAALAKVEDRLAALDGR